MLLPIYLGICSADSHDAGHSAAAALMSGAFAAAVVVALLHATAMIVSGGCIALAVHEWLGPRFISKSWFNSNLAWALSLVGVGIIGLVFALSSPP
jgi:hypothetical protein